MIDALGLSAAALLPPVLTRATRLVEIGGLQAADAQGLAADLGAGVLGAAAAGGGGSVPWGGRGRLAGLALLLAWCALNWGNYEHVRTLGTMVSAAYAGFLGDGVFLAGSALHISHPLLFLLSLILVGGIFWRSRRPSAAPTARLALTAGAALAAWALTPRATGGEVAAWRQQHFLYENLRWAGVDAALEPAPLEIEGLYPADLDGARRVAPRPGANVLVVLLEGISGAYLDSVAAHHGVTGERPRLPSLDGFAGEHLAYTTFFNHQRQTNRGLYSVLCGDLPRQLTRAPKMSEYGWGDAAVDCLPAALGRAGYETVFVQAAPLGFMGKDRFMPRAGFERVHGEEWFTDGYEVGQWGVDDGAFFERAAALIDELRGGDAPWMLALLTSGTHHPFAVPASFEGAHPPGTFLRAVEYLDGALDGFLRALEASGALEDTLVVITSDESFGRDGDYDNDSLMLAQAFGTLTVAHPGDRPARIEAPYLQMDVALSALDYLGLADPAGRAGGRSVFRDYGRPRALPFANTYMRAAAAIHPDGRLFVCGEDFLGCRGWRRDDDRYFGPGWRPAPAEPDDVALLRRVVRRSLYTGAQTMGAVYTLVEPGQELDLAPMKTIPDWFSSVRNQYLAVEAGARLYVDLELEVLEGGFEEFRVTTRGVRLEDMPSGMDFAAIRAAEAAREEAGLVGESTLGMRPRFFDRRKLLYRHIEPAMGAGGRLVLRLDFPSAWDMERVNCELNFMSTGAPPRIRVHHATLRLGRGGPGGGRVELHARSGPR